MSFSNSSGYDEEKHFLMVLVLNAKIPITEACKKAAETMGGNLKAEALR